MIPPVNDAFTPVTYQGTPINSQQLTAQLGVDSGSGKLMLIGGYNVTDLQELVVAPGVRAWRLTTLLRPLPGIATLAILNKIGNPSVWPVLALDVGTLPVITVLVYLDSAFGPVDPAVALLDAIAPGQFGFVYLSATPAGRTQLVAP